MDSQDQRQGAVKRLVSVLRRITSVIRFIPFAYLLFFSVYALLNLSGNETLLSISDSILTITPMTTALLLFLSRILRLCVWHKVACVIPVTSDVSTFIDSNLFQFTQNEMTVISVSMVLAITIFLVLAFIKLQCGR